MACNLAKLIKLFVHSGCYHVSLAELGGCLRMHGLSEIFEKFCTVSHLSDEFLQSLHALALTQLHDRSGLAETSFELHHLARHDLAGCCTGYDSFKVTYITDHGLETLQVILAVDEVLDHRISVFQFLKVHHRHCQPCSQEAGSHRRGALVHDLDKRGSLLSRRGSEYFQITEGETVHPYERALVYAGYRADVLQVGVLGLLQIDEQGTGRSHSERESVNGKTLQGIHPELPLEPLDRTFIDEGPLFEGRDIVLVAVAFPRAFLISAGNEKLLRSE